MNLVDFFDITDLKIHDMNDNMVQSSSMFNLTEFLLILFEIIPYSLLNNEKKVLNQIQKNYKFNPFFLTNIETIQLIKILVNFNPQMKFEIYKILEEVGYAEKLFLIMIIFSNDSTIIPYLKTSNFMSYQAELINDDKLLYYLVPDLICKYSIDIFRFFKQISNSDDIIEISLYFITVFKQLFLMLLQNYDNETVDSSFIESLQSLAYLLLIFSLGLVNHFNVMACINFIIFRIPISSQEMKIKN